MRRGIAKLDGEGEVTGGIVVMRSGGNLQVIAQPEPMMTIASGQCGRIRSVWSDDGRAAKPHYTHVSFARVMSLFSMCFSAQLKTLLGRIPSLLLKKQHH